MGLLPLDPDQLLTTTRAVRKRLDLTRPVPDELVRQCAAAALQAPSGSNNLTMQFVVVRDADKRAAIAALYAEAWAIYRTLPSFAGAVVREDEVEQAQQQRVTDSATYLAEHFADVPVMVLACTTSGRIDGAPSMLSASMLGNILPAMWSFMLAARARGLGTAWTTIHLLKEQEVAAVLDIPYDSVQQVCLSPLAYTLGTDFRPAARPEPDAILRWDTW